MEILEQLPQVLLPWYYVNQRDLPWRQDKQPYHVWLSEIMLQQTRVEAVKGYYARFLQALHTVSDLAACDEEVLHKLWEGLGYYSRVRNLKKAAQVIVEKYDGQFPRQYEDVLALPGIGTYTAGAICSICYDDRTPAVDGNVLRVVTRLTEDGTPIDTPTCKRAVEQRLRGVYPKAAGDFTQALMELGATVCGPNRKPGCDSCPCKAFCGSAIHGTAERYPVKGEKKARKEQKMTLFILSSQGKFALQKRPGKGLLASMWQFPNVSGYLEPNAAMDYLENTGLRPRRLMRQLERSHIFTHVQWQMRGYFVEVAEPGGEFTWMTEETVENEAALPTAFRQFWEEKKHV